MVHTGAPTENITLVEAVCGDDCSLLAAVLALSLRGSSREDALVMRKLGWPAPSMMLSIRRGGGMDDEVADAALKARGWVQVDHAAWYFGCWDNG
jgi:hypothetical protein